MTAHSQPSTSFQRTPLIIGLGSGRSGTVSLARLLDAQPGFSVTHEALEFQLRAEGSEQLVDDFLGEITGPSTRRRGTTVGDVFSAYLYYVEQIVEAFPGTRFVCLRRDRASTVKSFARKVEPANHWMEHDGTRWMSDPWDASFPKFSATTVEEAIGLYWDDYYERASAFETELNGQFRVFDLEGLNQPEGQAEILAFVGAPRPKKMVEVWQNRGGQK